jgi:glycosyltransferase involved in cell wall biosynthesis
MRICMVVSIPMPPQEGIGFYVWNLSRFLVRQGNQVQIITRGAAGQAIRDLVDGITIWRPFFVPLYPFHVHLHGLFVSKLVRKLGVEVDLFHCHSPLVPPIKTTRPVMLSVHSTIREDIAATKLDSWYTLLMKLQEPVSCWLEVENLKKATTVNAISPRVAEALQKYPHSPRNVPIVWNGVDTNIFIPRPGELRKEDFILTVSRLSPGKGLEDLIGAISSIFHLKKAIKLVIIGDGPLRHPLEQRVNDYGLNEQIRFEGHISDRNHLIGCYQKASLFVLPSHHEGLPTVILEAMACGCPVLATNVGGIPNVIEDGLNGVLIPPEDPIRMASVIQTLLANPERLNELGFQARHTIEQSFSWEIIGSKFLDLYSSMLQTGG